MHCAIVSRNIQIFGSPEALRQPKFLAYELVDCTFVLALVYSNLIVGVAGQPTQIFVRFENSRWRIISRVFYLLLLLN